MHLGDKNKDFCPRHGLIIEKQRWRRETGKTYIIIG